jgi:hypothetical protein
VEICGRARQATGNIIIRRKRFACWITKLQNYTRNINTLCFSTGKVVSLTCRNVTFIGTSTLSCYIHYFIYLSYMPFWEAALPYRTMIRFHFTDIRRYL